MMVDEKKIAVKLAEKYGIENPMEKLKEIALELLAKYKESEESLIWEYSGNIQEDTDDLVAEVEKFRERIEELTKMMNEKDLAAELAEKYNIKSMAEDIREMAKEERTDKNESDNRV